MTPWENENIDTENFPLSHASNGPFKNATLNANIFVYGYVTNKCEHLVCWNKPLSAPMSVTFLSILSSRFWNTSFIFFLSLRQRRENTKAVSRVNMVLIC